MAARRALNPRLLKAFEEAAVEPFDMDSPGRVVEVPVPPEQFPQAPAPEAPRPPPSRFDVVREYLERTRADAAPPNLPEVDMAAAQQADAMATLAAGGRNAAAAFLGNRAAGFANPNVTSNVDAAKAAQAQRAKALADWAESQRRGRLEEAEVLGRSLAEPGKKDPENEKAKRDLERERLEFEKEQKRIENELKRDKLEFDKTRPRGNGAKAAEKKAAAEAKAKAAGFKSSMDLRKEFNNLPEVKDFKDVDVAFRKIQNAAKNVSAAGDLSLIFGYMKMLDPGSTVREGEFANAQNAGGIDDKLRAAYNNVTQGQRLTESQRADFLAQARGVYEAQRAQFDSAREMYRTLAEKGGIDPDDVTGGVQRAADAGAAPTGPRADGKVPMVSTASGATVFLSPAAAEKLEKEGKVRKP